MCAETDQMVYDRPDGEFVSRGGLKLAKALKAFHIDMTGSIVLDIGASTGGFTDCALKHGARRVYAYDVGTDQLDIRLKNDPRVISREQVNCRYLRKHDIEEPIDMIVMDVSFISCTKMLEAVSDILDPGKEAVILFKPQFEVGPQYLNGHGIVRDDKISLTRLEEVKAEMADHRLKVIGTIVSPIKGKDGNTEYLMYLQKTE